ncbi:MAG: 30S ribosomal protein S1 [Candidatus Sumerlaeia bacterium]|nr:30S ribosomal protein S1 [Candidatus Sumerlaeia bacterium]
MTPEPENKNHEPEEKVTGSEEETSSSLPDDPEEGNESSDPDEEDFAALLEQHMGGDSTPSRGELVEVTVVEIREDKVLISYGGKAEASISINEFPVVGGVPQVKEGDTIPVVQTGMKGGDPTFSHRQARNRAAQDAIQAIFQANESIKGTVTNVVKGGLMVDIGLDAFMPASQVDINKVQDLNAFVGQEIEARIKEFDPRRNRAVVSRRELLVERRSEERRGFLEKLEVGQVITGRVKAAQDFGVFVDLGVLDGFIPREEVSWDRGCDPKTALKSNSEIELKILNVSVEEEKVTLSRRRLTENPWDVVDERYPIGSAVQGKVVAIQSYGAFVHLEEGLTGMIHVADMSWNPGNKRPQDHVREGDEITCQVLEINREKKRLSLGLKQLAADPWEGIEKSYPTGAKVRGTVTSLKNYGAFIRLDDAIEGMVHVSDISWEKRVGHPKEHLKVGDEIDVEVLKIDYDKRRISLGVKQLTDSPYDAYIKANPTGSIVQGKVTRCASFGAFVELAEGLEGLIHIGQIDTKRIEVPEEVLKAGDEVTVKIIKVDRKAQKISLSRREALRHAEKEQIKPYLNKNDSTPGGMSLGDALREAKERQKDS